MTDWTTRPDDQLTDKMPLLVDHHVPLFQNSMTINGERKISV